jgi:hypothetical protein
MQQGGYVVMYPSIKGKGSMGVKSEVRLEFVKKSKITKELE